MTEPQVAAATDVDVVDVDADDRRVQQELLLRADRTLPQPRVPVVHLLRNHAATRCDDIGFAWLDHRGVEVAQLTYGDLWYRAGVLAQHLVSAQVGLVPGDRAMLLFPPGLEFLPALMACLRCGVVAVSVYSPDPSKLHSDLPKLQAQASDAGARVALTSVAFKAVMTATSLAGFSWPDCLTTWIATDGVCGLTPLTAPVPTLQCQRTDEVMHAGGYPTRRIVSPLKVAQPSTPPPPYVAADIEPRPETVVFFQYTSGSTGNPRGVMITNRALSHNVAFCRNTGSFASCQAPAMCSWLPQYHDLGLIGMWLTGAGGGTIVYGLSPVTFMRNPCLWPEAMVKYSCTHTAAPTFGWTLAAKRCVAAEKRLDLSVLHTAIIGAEPVTPECQELMQTVLHVRREAICTSYGSAEVVLGVISWGVGFDGDTGIASCGSVQKSAEIGSHLVVVDPETLQELPEGKEGLLLIQSPSMTAGYHGQPQQTRERFNKVIAGPTQYRGYWYDSRDMAYIKNGLLYVLGRQTDLIIINGRNIYPNDVELTVNRAMDEWIRPGNTVAFQVAADQIALLAELRRDDAVCPVSELARVAQLVQTEHGAVVRHFGVHLKGSLPRTTSGKVRRKECRKQLLANALTPLICWPPQQQATASTILKQELTAENWAAFLTENGVVDVDRSLTANGVDSIQLNRFMAAAEARFGLKIRVSDVDNVAACDLWRSVSDSTAPAPPPKTPMSYEGNGLPPGWRRGALQLLGVALLVCLVSACAIPAGYVFNKLPTWIDAKHAEPWLTTWEGGPGILMIVVPLVWMCTLTVSLLLVKWLLIGRYRSAAYTLWSPSFFRWWFVDRLADVWDGFVGLHMVDTPYLNVLYTALGAHVAWRSRLQCLVREYDLLTVGPESTVGGMLNMRVLDQRGVWFGEQVVRASTKTPGHIVNYPGQDLRAVSTSPSPTANRATVEVMFDPLWFQRALAPAAVVTAFGVGVYVSSWVTWLVGISDPTWRFVLCMPGSAFCVLIESVIITRLGACSFIGDRLGATACNTLRPFVSFSVLLVWLFRAYGARLGVGVTMNKFQNLAPSDAHKVQIGQNTHLSRCSLAPGSGRIVIGSRVSVGYLSQIKSGVEIQDRAGTFPFAFARPGTLVPRGKVLIGDQVSQLGSTSRSPPATAWFYLVMEPLSLLAQIATSWLPIGCGFEVVRQCVLWLPDKVWDWPLWAAVWVGTAWTMVVAAAVMSFIIILAQWVYFPRVPATGSRELRTRSLATALYSARLTMMDCWAPIQVFINGSMMLNAAMKACGATMPGWTDTLLMECAICDPRLTTFGKQVVVDRGANVSAHNLVGDSLILSRTRIGDRCELHPVSFVRAQEQLQDDTVLCASSAFYGPRDSVRPEARRVYFRGAPARRCQEEAEDHAEVVQVEVVANEVP